MIPTVQFIFLCFAILLVVFDFAIDECLADESILSRPVAIAVSADNAFAFIANQKKSCITVVDVASQGTHQIQVKSKGFMDLVWSAKGNRLHAISSSPPQVHQIAVEPDDSVEIQSHELPAIPERITLSIDERFLCISMTWMHAVCIVELQEGRLPKSLNYKILPLDFQPKEVLAIKNEQFLVADAFGGQLAVMDAASAKTIASHRILGHHIGGLARDDSSETIAIAHQRLSSVAHTNRDDIHWGALIQNLVSVIPEARLVDPASNIARSTERFPLGDVGNGAADPSGIVAWDGNLCVAITGTNQIAFRAQPKGRFVLLPIDQSPTRLVRLGDSKIMWISTLGDTAGILERVGDHLETRGTIGKERAIESPEDRGEQAFYSGRLSHDGWMSCSSCHVNGHSPDLLADTKGDGKFDSPKRIPSLLNVSHTGPWTWNGTERSLQGQIEKTLSTTMHRDPRPELKGDDDTTVAANIAAFLATQRLPFAQTLDSAKRSEGERLFHERGCVKCHQPDLHYSSPGTYDVGVVDETGERKFNPPSLEGLRHRKRLFHDGRFTRAEELLRSHPNNNIEWTPDEIASLSIFLRSL